MKNTAKKILALVFAVVMVCSLAIPAFAAADDKIAVTVTVVGQDGDALVTNEKVELSAKNQNVLKALKNEVVAKYVTTSATTGKVTYFEGEKVSAKAIVGEFGTGEVVVSLNGKAVSEDLNTVAVEDGDHIVVYWADSTLGTVLALVDANKEDLAKGIISLYYYDAEGNRQPLVDAYITLRDKNNYPLRDRTNVINEDAADSENVHEFHFVTDEKGQIWIAPEYLDDADTWTIDYAAYNNKPEATTYAKSILDAVETDKDNTDAENDYITDNQYANVVDVEVIGYEIAVSGTMYNTADATGDMTMVYVLVAAAAVVTLAAVVVMKKKAVKAN